MPEPEALQLIAPAMQERASLFSLAIDQIEKDGGDMQLMLPMVAKRLGIGAFEMLNPPMKAWKDPEETGME